MTSPVKKVESLGFWETLRLDLKDQGVLRMIYAVLSRPGSLAIFLFRCSHYFHDKGPLGRIVGMIFWRLNILLNSCEIEPVADIGPGLHIFHASGIVIGKVQMGKNASLYQNVTIGRNPTSQGLPVIGDDVTLYAGAVVAGEIQIGSDVVIGANAVITRNVPDGAIVRAPHPEIKLRELPSARTHS